MKRSLPFLIYSLGTLNLLAQDSDTDKTAGAAGALIGGTCGCVVLLIMAAIWIALAVWVYKDAKSRGMDNAMLLTIVTVITGVLGLIIYLLMRPKGNLVVCTHCQKKRIEGSAKMPALRPAVKFSRGFWVMLAAIAALAVVAAIDWRHAPPQQLSVQLYDRGVHYVYRGFVRQFSSRFVRCRYIPSCSQYSLQAMYMHGFPRGIWLTTKRICRCLPWTPMGTYDPVPPPKTSSTR